MAVRVNLKQIDAFRAVMIAGSTSEAAGLLNVSQPAVSRLLQNLESYIDFRLFIRQNGRLYPTPEAEALLHEVEQVYSGLDHLSSVMKNIKLLEGGHLRIVVSTPMAQRLLPEVLAQFQEQRPDIRVSIRIVVKREMPKWLDAQQFDVALVTFPVDYPSAHLLHLASVNGVCVLPPGHRLCDKPMVRAEDLAEEHFISIISDTILRMKVDQAFAGLGVQRKQMRIETQSGASICNLVAAGLGVSIVDPFTASALDGKGLVMKPFRPIIGFDFGVLLPIQRPRSQLVDEFIEVVREQARAFEESHETL
ncbi:DNA-binding transcriptional regulator, LysR family [Modicisalibacter muralis]|uniref:DNA-binding transcriptional regulator, LysR family n=1 Tax=Modicisalibacter muralis TaxID=119000 RepID=A0A1G9LMK7_9GAMM|nr:LysR substrate-binding domain-containing protein [Halomonas muralis]SDL63126.1 DNA-binding transcriptional regulator, LysR family [Halomonas muralis]